MNKSLQFVNSLHIATEQLEKLHLQFCRNILGVRTTTPNFMTYGELGRTPIDILCIKLRIVNFWNKTYFKQEET
jgi:hypothetical protein